MDISSKDIYTYIDKEYTSVANEEIEGEAYEKIKKILHERSLKNSKKNLIS